jgi:hypothetical protein
VVETSVAPCDGLLSLQEAAAACREGKTVRGVEGGDNGMLFRRYPDGVYECNDGDGWEPCQAFPDYFGADASALRYEVVRNEVEQDETPSLTLAQVAKLPVGTKVVVDCGDETIPTGMAFSVRAHASSGLPPQALLTEFQNGCCWCITVDCASHLTFKVVR